MAEQEMHDRAMKARRKVLLRGAPGAGKTLWARELSATQTLWTLVQHQSYIWRAAGLSEEQTRGLSGSGEEERAPVFSRIFRAPHHSVSVAGMTGAIAHGWFPRPGELSLAHGGVLFLDEAQEFRRDVLEAVRDAWRWGYVEQRTRRDEREIVLRLPAVFSLVAAMTPCPCGYYGAGPAGLECKCSAAQVTAYQNRMAWFFEGFEVVELAAKYPRGLRV